MLIAYFSPQYNFFLNIENYRNNFKQLNMAVEFYINMCVCAFKEKSRILIISGKEQAASIRAGMKIAMTFTEDSTIILSL